MKARRCFLAIVFLALGVSGFGQNTEALHQSFNAPKADVEQALKDINAYQGGRLPFLNGFVGSIDAPLAQFQRAYYQYSIEVVQVTEAEVAVSVNAKISAWKDDKDPSKSGYQELPSNGRLETDLLDRLRTRLREHAAEVAANRVPLVSPKLLGTELPPSAPSGTASTQPDAPSSATQTSSGFKPFSGTKPLPPSANSPEQDARYQRLVQEEKSLQDVISAQQHPEDLVAVKVSHTPVFASPADGSKVVMYADAEDEFQFLKTEGEYTHVQIAGLSRGWIRTSALDKTVGGRHVEAQATAPSFTQTKEETSTFPGDWDALRGKNVRIIWVQPNGNASRSSRLKFVQAVFRKQAPELAKQTGVDGLVVVFDAADGGMAAATLSSLQAWGEGTLSDPAFLKQCWFDPVDAFTAASR